MNFDNYINSQLAEINQKEKLRVLRPVNSINGKYIVINGKKLINFGSNDYLGLSQNKKVVSSAKKALKEFGLGATSSRLICGNNILYNTLEQKLASYKGFEACLVFGSGYLANIGVLQAIATKDDLILADKLVHNCIISGITLSGATLKRFNHNNYVHLEKLAKEHRSKYKNCFIISEGIFSMDGDRADINKLNEIAKKHSSITIIDDAHSTFEKQKIVPDILIGTLSKAIGAYGGYVCANKNVIDLILNKAGSLIFSTALAPSILAGSIKALEIIQKNQTLTTKGFERAGQFCQILNLPKPQSQIVPFLVKDNKAALNLAQKLFENGFFMPAIRPPTVKTPRLRFSFSSFHAEKDIKNVAEILNSLQNSV